jgi:pyruvate formate lyase activating enzyme
VDAGIVFNIQRFSVHDGPGIRTTIFLKGCPGRCPWCHNPESQSPRPELVTFPERCIACGSCREVCPRETDPARCTACGACVDPCPADARQIAGRQMRVAEVMAVVERDRLFYDESGGGVTFSGGEPFAQPRFLLALLRAAKANGLRTVVDTCGFVSRDVLLAAAPLVDLFLYDLKTLDPIRHREVVGLPLAPILDNLDLLATTDAHVWIRVPIVPGFTDDPSALAEAARIAQGNLAVRRVHLLPYHASGGGKFARLGREYALGSIPVPPAARLAELADLFRARGLATRVGG